MICDLLAALVVLVKRRQSMAPFDVTFLQSFRQVFQRILLLTIV